MKSVLLITDRCAPTPSSNAACIMKVAEALRHQNVEVTILSLYDSAPMIGIYGERFFSLGIKTTCIKMTEKLFGYIEDKKLVTRIVQYAIELNDWLHFDLVLGVFRPIESVLAGIEIANKLNILGASCFFDLPIVHGLQDWKNKIFDFNYKRLYRLIIRTNKLIALKYYKNYFNMRLNHNALSKIEYIGVPNLQISEGSHFVDADRSSIKLVYTGSFYERIRNPQKMFEYLRPIIGTDIVLHLYSWGCEDVVNEYQKIYRNNLVCHGKVSYDIAHQAMIDADILLNLSNDDENQVPGKIMEYFSLGKAVLNLKFREDDAGNCEYDRYPLIYDVNLRSAVDQDDIVNVLYSFVGKHVSAERIGALFFDSTPEYFTSLLEQRAQNEHGKMR